MSSTHAYLANQAAGLLGLSARLESADIHVEYSFVGPGYGVATQECTDAIALLARTEGILLDPSYTGKAMAGMITHVRGKRYDPDQSVVFVHTGGTPALFAYRDELVDMIDATPIPRSTR